MLHPDPRRAAAFTLIELLTVIAVIGILAAILIPTVSSVRHSATKARVKVQFNQWAAAIEAFRGEYGYYPRFTNHKINDGAGAAGDHLFHDILAGRRRDGSALGAAAAAQNRKRIAFYDFGESDFAPLDSATPGLIQDAAGNTEIAVLVDRDLDGMITASDYDGALPVLNGMRPSAGTTEADFPQAGLRLKMVFYARDPRATASEPGFIFSWK